MKILNNGIAPTNFEHRAAESLIKHLEDLGDKRMYFIEKNGCNNLVHITVYDYRNNFIGKL